MPASSKSWLPANFLEDASWIEWGKDEQFLVVHDNGSNNNNSNNNDNQLTRLILTGARVTIRSLELIVSNPIGLSRLVSRR